MTYVNIGVRFASGPGQVRRGQENGPWGRGVPYRSAEGSDSVGGNGDARNHACVEAEVRCRFSIRRMSDYAAANIRPTRLSGQRQMALPTTINTVTPIHVQVYTDRRNKNALDIP